MQPILAYTERLYDALHRRWEGVVARRSLGTLLVVAYLAALVFIELNRLELLPGPIAWLLPTNHFRAVDLAFTLLLVIEILALVWTLADSVSRSVGKQFELLSLILLRKAFLEFGKFGEPIAWDEITGPLLHMLADVAAALAIFAIVGLYYRVQRHQRITSERDQASFVAAKKAVALLLLTAFLVLGVVSLWQSIVGAPGYPFFEAFYLVLIFADILIVLIAMRYSYSYQVVFRNSGFAFSTVVIRLALTAPPYYNAALGVGAALFALALTVAYNAFAPVMSGDRHGPAEGEVPGGAGGAEDPG